jgi:hypothetical protein
MIDYNGDKIIPVEFKNDQKYGDFKKHYTHLDFIEELLVDGEDLISYVPPYFYNSYRSEMLIVMGVYFDDKAKLLKFRIIKYKNGVKLKKFKITKAQYYQFNSIYNIYKKIIKGYTK